MRNESGLEGLWKRRSSAFRKEIAPYIRYMGQSGFPSFLSLLLIVSAVGYIGLLRGLPDDFPVVPAGVAALTPALCWSPLRTWLAPADIVYLMPREARMGAYLRMSARYSAAVSAVPAVIVLLLYLSDFMRSGRDTLPRGRCFSSLRR
jgi:Predicted ABC-type exoprotein transport system, permease component